MKNKYQLLLFAFIIIHSTLLLAQRTFDTKVDYATGPWPYSVAIGDLNGDGKADWAVANANNNTVSVFTNTGTGSFGAKKDYTTGSSPRCVAIGDFNGDGAQDLAVANYSGTSVSVFTNTGNGSFGAKVDYSTGLQPSNLAIGDLNGDGKVDLVVVNTSSSTSISIFTNTGTGSFGAKVDYITNPYPNSVAIGDLNGDGKPDLAAAHSTSNTICVFTNTGIGSFGAKQDYPAGSNPQSIAIGDLNGDGSQDLVVANSAGSNTISVFTNTGAGSFGAKVDYATGSNPYSVAIGDLNGDGKADLAVTSNVGNTIIVFTNTGTGGFGFKKDYGTGNRPISVAIGDFNGDGKADLAVANFSSSSVSIMLAKDEQLIDGFTANSSIMYGSQFVITASSGLAVTASSSNSSILSISGSNAVAVSLGVVTITAFQSGNATFAGVTLTGVLTVTQANLSIAANNFSRTYGLLNPIFTSTITGLVNGDLVSVSYSTIATSLSGIGNYPITISVTGSSLANYSLNTTNATLTITKANLAATVYSFSRSYGSANPLFTSSVSGLVNGDVVSVSYSTTATSLSGVGVYPISISVTGSALANYSLNATNATLTITKANLSIAANNFSRTYGLLNPIFTSTITGLVNGDLVSVSYSTIATSLSGIGNYPITISVTGSSLANYSLNTTNATLTITKANLAATVNSFSRSYGSANPLFTSSVSGLVNGDVVSVSYSTTATSLSGVGVYPISISVTGSALANYSLNATNATLTITKANLSVSANSFSRNYGKPNPVFTSSISGLLNGDVVSVFYSTTATSLSGVGIYPISISVTGSSLANYSLNTTNATLTITKANLSVVANSFSRAYGTSNPIFTSSISGLLNGDVVSVSYSTTATSLSGVGVYPISISVTGSSLANYLLNTSNATLTITKANFVSTVPSPILSNTNVYNGLPIVPSITGLLTTVGVTYTYNGSSSPPSNADTYTIVGVITDPNFNTTTLTSVVVISYAPLTITAFNASKKYGEANPTLTGTVVGMVNNDVIIPAFSTVANTISNVGSYPITATATGSNIDNYALTIENSTLTIEKAEQTISLQPIADFTFSGVNAIVTLSGSASSGLPLSFEVAVSPEGAAVYDTNTNELNFTATGIATVTGIQLGNSNYNSALAATLVISATKEATLPSGINDVSKQAIITIFPNPSSGICFVETQSETSISVYNVFGILVENFNTNQKQSFTLSSKGLYIIKAQQGEKLKTLKLEIE